MKTTQQIRTFHSLLNYLYVSAILLIGSELAYHMYVLTVLVYALRM